MAEPKPERATQLNIRVDDALKVQLEESARARGNSLNAEIKERLAQSLRPRPYWDTLVENPKINGVIDLIALITFATGHNAGSFSTLSSDRWCDDPYAFNQVAEAIRITVEALRPRGDASIPDTGLDAELYSRLGSLMAQRILREVVGGMQRLGPGLTVRAERLRESLGDEIVDRIAKNLEKSS